MITFDFISDLYLTAPTNYNWRDKVTSLYCIVAGNITDDRSLLFDFLEEVQQYYNIVFFIDGELEHVPYQGNIEASYLNLRQGIASLDRTVFLYENIVILDDVTIIGANGWTTFDFTNKSTVDLTIDYLTSAGYMTENYANEIFKLAVSDQHYLYNSIEACQSMPECGKIIVVTNTVPKLELIDHNPDFNGTALGDTSGNNGLLGCLTRDKKNKVTTWAFGKFTENVDSNIEGIRYTSNPGKEHDFDMYFPKRIEV